MTNATASLLIVQLSFASVVHALSLVRSQISYLGWWSGNSQTTLGWYSLSCNVHVHWYKGTSTGIQFACKHTELRKHSGLMLREPNMMGVPPLTLGEGERTGNDRLFFLQMLRKTWGPLQTDWNGFFSRPVRPCWNQGARLTKYPTCTFIGHSYWALFCSLLIYFLFDLKQRCHLTTVHTLQIHQS